MEDFAAVRGNVALGRGTVKCIVLLTFLLATSASACINTYGGALLDELEAHKASREKIGAVIKRLELKHAAHRTPLTANDLAVAHIFAGNYRKAIAILRKLEATHPGLAKTAANLGTALELSGKNTEALHWIRQGILRDKNEHEGTEWLHVKILEAKIAIEQDPHWLNTHTVLGIDFGGKGVFEPRMPKSLPRTSSGEPLTLQAVEKALHYQTSERLKFVTRPDAVMANLFADRARIAGLLGRRDVLEHNAAANLFKTSPPASTTTK